MLLLKFLLWIGPTLRSVVTIFPCPAPKETWWFHHSFLRAGEGPHYCRLLNQLLWFSRLPEGRLRKQGTGTPDALSSGSGTGYVGQHVGSGRLVLVLLTPLMLSSSLIFRGNSVVLPLVPRSWAEDTEFLQIAQTCHYSSLAFPTSTVGRKGCNSQHCFLCQLCLVVIKST